MAPEIRLGFEEFGFQCLSLCGVQGCGNLGFGVEGSGSIESWP